MASSMAREHGGDAVYAMKVYLLVRVADEITDRVVDDLLDDLVARIRQWCRDTGNTKVTVPIDGPDRTTILRTVECDADDA